MVFERNKKEGTDELTFNDFKKMVPCKNVEYFNHLTVFQHFINVDFSH